MRRDEPVKVFEEKFGAEPFARRRELNHGETSVALLLAAEDALVDRLAPGEAFLLAVPVSDLVLAQLPAEQNDVTFHNAGKIEQPDIEVLHLHTGGVNFGDRVLGARTRSLTGT